MVSPIRCLIRSALSSFLALTLVIACAFRPSSAHAQRAQAKAPDSRSGHSIHASSGTVPVIFISDIHFDPFHDPGKAQQLLSAPVSEWKTIFDSSPSANQQQAFEQLQGQCHAKGEDTSPALLQSALAAMKARQPGAKFMMVSGDLVVHNFTCRYQTLFPGSSPSDYQAFVLKTMSYVAGELRSESPDTPVYAALGNNDSGCGDYQFDPGSDFFAKAGSILALGLPVTDQRAAVDEFAMEGNYSVMMASPMKNTRLVVLNDTLLSPKYKTCAGKRDSKGADEEVLWLRKQLEQARRLGQHVWVMGHIPPGVDPFSTAEKFTDICGGVDPAMFLSSDEIPDLMVEYADVVELGIFAHTHMDEVRLLGHSSGEASAAHQVAVKMIPSISPVHGNQPSFTVARINAASAGIQDYSVIAASNQSGINTQWKQEYNYAQAYHQAEFSAHALNELIGKFRLDSIAALPESQDYLRSYYVGNLAAQLSPFWPQYVCVLNNYTGKDYAACVCHTGQ
jgi:sphingomyelin phosphodiesterase acid-like 3